jgi:hypothetical protein
MTGRPRPGDAEAFGVPEDLQRGRLVRKTLGLLDHGPHTVEGLDPRCDASSQDVHWAHSPAWSRFAHISTAVSMPMASSFPTFMAREKPCVGRCEPRRRGRGPCARGASRTLRSAKAFASAVGHEGGAVLQVDVGHGQTSAAASTSTGTSCPSRRRRWHAW